MEMHPHVEVPQQHCWSAPHTVTPSAHVPPGCSVGCAVVPGCSVGWAVPNPGWGVGCKVVGNGVGFLEGWRVGDLVVGCLVVGRLVVGLVVGRVVVGFFVGVPGLCVG